MNWIIILPLLIGFIVTFTILPAWIKRAKHAGLEGRDMQKSKKRMVAEVGGVGVLAGFMISIFVYVAIKTFYFNSTDNLIDIFALSTAIMMMAFIGLIDDILGWKIGLGKKLRIFLVLVAAIPFIAIKSGQENIVGMVSDGMGLGIFYPLIIVPIGIVGATTTFNMLAGYNGLEASQGALIIGALSLLAYGKGITWLAFLGVCMVLCLLAFLYYNRFPAKIFPGDSLTYPVGAMIALMAILGGLEWIAVFFFIPYILEVILKLRAGIKLDKESFAKPNSDDSLELPYKKVYGLEHFSLWFLKKVKPSHKVYEKDIVYFINSMQIVIIIIGMIIFV